MPILAAGCGGGGGSGPATVPTTTSTIEVVDDGDQDQLYSLTPQFDLHVTGSGGYVAITSSLVEVQDPTGLHPYGASWFFFEGTLSQNLAAGQTYSVSLGTTNSSCTPLAVMGTFST